MNRGTLFTRLMLLVALPVVAGLGGCTRAALSLPSSALLNAEYQLPVRPGERVATRDGKWQQEGAGGRETLTVVDTGLRSDLDADEAPDAAVLMVYSGGGSGTFSYLAAVLNDDGRPRHVSSIELGDRVQVRSVVFDKGRIVASLLVQGEHDPMCCPTASRTRAFELVDEQLVEVVGS